MNSAFDNEPGYQQNLDAHHPIEWSYTSKERVPRMPESTSMDFMSVLNKRRSRRSFSVPLEEQVGELLYQSHRVQTRDSTPDGLIVDKRPVISSGSLHCISCFIKLPNKEWQVYEPFHQMMLTPDIDSEYLEPLIVTANSFLEAAKQAAKIWYVADLTRIEGKYTNAESLVWRDAGALLATQSLVSEYLGLAFCPLGLTGGQYAKHLLKHRKLAGVGVSLIGAL